VQGYAEIGPGSLAKALLDLHDDARSRLLKSVSDHGPGMGIVQQQEIDLGTWSNALGNNPELELLNAGRRELGFALYSAAAGLYRQAYNGVRLFLELSFATVNFSVHEWQRLQWLSGEANFLWGEALDQRHGFLSHSFVKTFFPPAAAEVERYRTMAAETYRHCSNYTHGRVGAKVRIPVTISYSAEAMSDWCATAKRAAETVLYLLLCRYGRDLLPRDDGSLTATLEFSLIHLPFVRTALSSSTWEV
jgi:hypothetical protein